MTGGLAHQLLGRALGMHPRLGQVLGLFLGPFLALLGTTELARRPSGADNYPTFCYIADNYSTFYS